MTLYSEPYVLGTKAIPSPFTFAQKVHASQMAQTEHGIYYLIDQKGWVSQEDLSRFDNRMQKVQEMLLQNTIMQIILSLLNNLIRRQVLELMQIKKCMQLVLQS